MAIIGAVPAAAADAVSRDLVLRIFPMATDIGELEGQPPAASIAENGNLAGYVFFTRQVVASRGYSGKPIDIAVGLDLDGRITGAEIVEQHEPILAIGVDAAALTAFAEAHRGRDVREPLLVRRRPKPDGNEIGAISGATISSVVISNTILSAARAVARSRGILAGAEKRFAAGGGKTTDWQGLLDDGSLLRFHLSRGEVETAFAETGAHLYPKRRSASNADETFIEIFAGLATPARIGRNLIGDTLYERIRAGQAADDQLVFLAAHGLYSFKGTRWVRRGDFERIQIVQGDRTFGFAKDDHIRLDKLAVTGAPELREMALFKLPGSKGFNAFDPWRLELLVAGKDSSDNRVLQRFAFSYTLPAKYSPPTDAAEPSADGLPWQDIWQSRKLDIGVMMIALLILTAVLVFQNAIVVRQRLYHWLRVSFLIFTLVWLGWYAAAQLSVMNVLTFTQALLTQFRWDVFLIEPLHFILWSFVAVAMLFWGRGVFCGWLCPFGALQDLANQLASRLRIHQIAIPFAVHERLWPIKYMLFLALFALSLGGIGYLHLAVEVEPFKTAVVLGFDRTWYFVLYPVLLLIIGLFIERFFCRYLCPLGAALAIPARLRMFEWLKRRWQCGQQCGICATHCPVQAIHPDGHINPNECIHCLHCQVLYNDDAVCPPLVQRRKRLAQLQRSAPAVEAALSARRKVGSDGPEGSS